MTSAALQFFGAAGTVTGSRHLLKTPSGDYLVDCGLFQGLKALRLLNWAPIPIDVSKLNAVILTHAHLDHCGYLPLLFRQGFRKTIYCSAPTRALTEIILRDSAKIQEEDAAIANKKRYTKHKPAVPLYTVQDVEKVLDLFQTVESDQWIPISSDLRFMFRKVGHILGAAFVEVEWSGRRIIFSGDIGRPFSPLLNAPSKPAAADYIVMESTYGDRLHPPVDTSDELAGIIIDTIRDKGNLLIPSFAVGRAQELMHMVNMLKRANRIPDIPVYLDSPMGSNATAIFRKYPDWHKLSAEECDSLFERVRIISEFEETLDVVETPGSKIVIAASGMLTGGRVLFYLEKYLEHKRNAILFTGYQAEGTRGRSLLQGTHEIKMHGSYYPVRARVRTLSAMSGHADQHEILDWLSEIKEPPKTVFLVHGEEAARQALRLKIESDLGWKVRSPVTLETFGLD
ncbi:MAG TPA: MBL fold metallo-hydrolase [Cyclobacteriaceae bacterium]|nr:MBL fold metallo-hydrolase [Cyclobacteriaceae bacterium]